MLSIGYAACHWCHVMERESFEDEATAELMNEHFVCIKVDREERPDLDDIYMDAAQAMTGSGGWPLTVFLTPDGEPFFAGTYFPPVPQHGLPSFPQLGVTEAWSERRDEVESRARRSPRHRRVGLLGAPRAAAGRAHRAASAPAAAFDDARGGFGGAPKFPQPMTLESSPALRGWEPATQIVTTTLDRMAGAGCTTTWAALRRYSTDARGSCPTSRRCSTTTRYSAPVHGGVPGHRRRPVPAVRRRRSSTAARDQRAEGGFTRAGRRQRGRRGEVLRVGMGRVGRARRAGGGGGPRCRAERQLGGNQRPVAAPGRLRRRRGAWPAARRVGGRGGGCPSDAVRDPRGRVHPATDDKVLTAWNALAIGALAEAGRLFARSHTSGRRCEARSSSSPIFGTIAAGCCALAERYGRRAGVRGRLRHHGGGVPHALRDDVRAAVVRGSGDAGHELLRLFHDDERGGFFQTGSDAEELVLRPKELYDNATPSGNSVAAETLLRLSSFTGDAELRTSRAFRAPPDPRRDGRGAHRVRTGALRARPLPGAVERGRDLGDPATAETRALAAVVTNEHIAPTSCWRWLRPTMPPQPNRPAAR